MSAAPILAPRHRTGAVLRLTLNRPAARNPLSEAMLAALTVAIDAAGRDPAVHAVVLVGDGPAFSAGHDLKELTARRADADAAGPSSAVSCRPAPP